ncbi:hypothetical protein BD414DRAFT_535975 [Trametes punicea]|nr:hypothetical protein BD414DRAFT_535975 [Trametes punicea]
MFAKLAAFTTLLVALVAANPVPSDAPQCNTGPNTNGQVGLECNNVNVFGGLDGTSCSAHPVCCDDVQHNGAFAVGCVPVSLN